MNNSLFFNDLIHAINNNLPFTPFITGGAGHKKSFAIETTLDLVRSHGKIAIATATSAFAAQIYPGGKTAHSVFKVCISFTLYSIQLWTIMLDSHKPTCWISGIAHQDTLSQSGFIMRSCPYHLGWNPYGKQSHFRMCRQYFAKDYECQSSFWWQNLHCFRQFLTNMPHNPSWGSHWNCLCFHL